MDLYAHYDQKVINALESLREFSAGPTLPGSLREAFKTLDNAGVFQEIDDHTVSAPQGEEQAIYDYAERDQYDEGYGPEDFDDLYADQDV